MKRLLSAVIACIVAAGVPADAQTYPNRAIRLVVPFAAGGGADVLARIVADKLFVKLGQPVVIETRPGASGTVGSAVVAKAEPDGYTLVIGSQTTHAVAGSYYKNSITYDPAKSFSAIAPIGFANIVVVKSNNFEPKTMKELISYIKTHDVNWAMGGNGTAVHLAGEMFNSMIGVKLTKIPFQGDGPEMVAILGGQVPYGFATMPAALSYILNKGVTALAVTSKNRSENLPDVPTIAESGVPDFDVVNWFGLFGPAGMPPEVIKRLSDAMQSIRNDADFRQKLTMLGCEEMQGIDTPEKFAAYQSREIDKWTKFIAETGLSPQ